MSASARQIEGVKLSGERGLISLVDAQSQSLGGVLDPCTVITERSLVPVVQRNVLFGLVGCFGCCCSIAPISSESMSGTSSLEKYAN